MSLEDNDSSGEDDFKFLAHEEEDKAVDEVDPEHLEYLQNQFQDLVNDIFEQIVDYVKITSLPICEFMTRDDVEVIIDELQSCES
jgi:hypothetical protein